VVPSSWIFFTPATHFQFTRRRGACGQNRAHQTRLKTISISFRHVGIVLQVQSTVFDLGFGVASRYHLIRDPTRSPGSQHHRLAQMTESGPAPLSSAGVRTRYEANTQVQAVHQGPIGSHSLLFGVAFDRSNITNRWAALGGLEQLLVEGAGAEVIRWNTPTQARQHVQNFYRLCARRVASCEAVGPSLWPAPGKLFRPSRQRECSSDWTTIEPRAGLVIPLLTSGLILRASFARYGHLLAGSLS